MSTPPPVPAQDTGYTPEHLRQAFRAAGLAGWRRVFTLLFTFLGFALGFWRDARTPEPERARRQRARAAWLRDRFIHLGPTFIKIGQVLSTRPDLLPLAYVDEMTRLQDQVPPFELAVARRILEEDLGRPPEEVFAILNPEPIAAASIGQVYKARLKDGADVVVKVQRPGLVETASLDLAILRKAAELIERRPRLARGMPYVAILDEFGASLFEQADFTREAAYGERFRENFRGFPGVAAPEVFWEHTRRRVLVSRFIHGMKVTDMVALEAAGVRFEEVVKVGVRATIKQILEDGFFHADVHPGNLFVEHDGTLVYIDFGMVGEISPGMQETIVDIFLHSVHKDYAALVDDFIRLGFLSSEVDRAALVPVAAHIFESQYGEKGRRLSVKEVFETVSEVLYEHPFRIPEKIAFILRTLITLEGIVHQLAPDFRFLDVAAPYAAKILLVGEKAAIREKLVAELFVGGEFHPERLGKLFSAASQEPTFRFGEVAPAVVTYLTSAEGARVREGLLAAIARGGPAGTPIPWEVYVARAAADPHWSLDDLALPLFAFLKTEAGAAFLIRLLDERRVAGRLTGGELGQLQEALGPVLAGRALSPAATAEGLLALRFLLGRESLNLQPFVERAARFLESPAGRDWFFRVGERLRSRQAGAEVDWAALLAPLLAEAAGHPHLDVSPLLRRFFQLTLLPEARAWQEVLLGWLKSAGASGAGGGLVNSLGPLFQQGRLRVSEVAWPAMGFLISKEGAPVRDELVATIRSQLVQASSAWPGAAQELLRAAGSAWVQWREGPGAPGRQADQ